MTPRGRSACAHHRSRRLDYRVQQRHTSRRDIMRRRATGASPAKARSCSTTALPRAGTAGLVRPGEADAPSRALPPHVTHRNLVGIQFLLLTTSNSPRAYRAERRETSSCLLRMPRSPCPVRVEQAQLIVGRVFRLIRFSATARRAAPHARQPRGLQRAGSSNSPRVWSEPRRVRSSRFPQSYFFAAVSSAPRVLSALELGGRDASLLNLFGCAVPRTAHLGGVTRSLRSACPCLAVLGYRCVELHQHACQNCS